MPKFQLSPKQKRNLSKILPLGLLWIFFALIYIFIEKGLLGDSKIYPSTKNPYNFQSALITTTIGSLIFGMLFGTLEVVYFNSLFRKISFGKKLLYKTLIYGLIIFLFLSSLTLIGNSLAYKTGIFDPRVINSLVLFVTSFAFFSINLYIVTTIIISLFILEVSDNLGQGVLKNFITGKYHEPREEERVFMFLDMRSSTTIAEKLGHTQYYKLLNEYYADITKAILISSGEIYQYVGDEIIVSWKLEKGIIDNNCLMCFYRIKAIFNEMSQKYMDMFGLVPGFKAGLHLGHVTTGEIGIIKKEIVFTGDVLNTTSRIQGTCNSYDVDILISNELIALLNIENQFQVKEIGEIELRGRNAKVHISTINPHKTK